MTPDFAGLFIKMIAGLLLVLVLAVVLIRFILPRARRGFWGRRAPSWILVLDRVPLEARKSLYLVKILERYFVLGGSEQAVQLITELSRPEGEKIESEK